MSTFDANRYVRYLSVALIAVVAGVSIFVWVSHGKPSTPLTLLLGAVVWAVVWNVRRMQPKR